MALKFLRDGVESANLIAMPGVNGYINKIFEILYYKIFYKYNFIIVLILGISLEEIIQTI
jgi:hypothetical protein